MCFIEPHFCMGAGNLNSGVLTCTTRTLLTHNILQIILYGTLICFCLISVNRLYWYFICILNLKSLPEDQKNKSSQPLALTLTSA